MEHLNEAFQERLREIEIYLDLLDAIEAEARSGPPRLGASGPLITTQQQKILYSGVFLQLYNLVEASIVKCLDGVTEIAVSSHSCTPGDLTSELRREWVRVMARTHIDLTHENRLASALTLCEHLMDALPVRSFKMEKSNGSWDDSAIEKVVLRLGLNLQVTQSTYSAIKRKVRDDLGPLALVKKFRNLLAHGGISFVECGENFTARELRELANSVAAYIREVVQAFEAYISGFQFIAPSKRPLTTAT